MDHVCVETIYGHPILLRWVGDGEIAQQPETKQAVGPALDEQAGRYALDEHDQFQLIHEPLSDGNEPQMMVESTGGVLSERERNEVGRLRREHNKREEAAEQKRELEEEADEVERENDGQH